MDEEGAAENDSNVIWSACDVLALDLDLCPTIVERVLELGFDDKIAAFLFDEAWFIAVNLFWIFDFHNDSYMLDKFYYHVS